MTTARSSEKAQQSFEEAKKSEPGLAPYYQFYQRVFRLQAESRAAISYELELADQNVMQIRMSQGLPQVSFAQLPIEPISFKKLVLSLTEALLEYQGGEGEDLINVDLDWVSIAREQFEKRQGGAPPSLLEIAIELATMPYLEWAAEQVMPHLDEKRWQKGSCPICGGEPNFAYLENGDGSRWLVCSRCRAEWRYKRMLCPFCDNKDPAKLKYYPAGEKKTHRVYVCDTCLRYLKVVDLRVAGTKIDLMAEPVLRWSLDKAAREMGYV